MLISAAGDLVTFSKLKVHYQTDYALQTDLFTKETRPRAIKSLYEAARDRNEPEVSVTQVSIRVLCRRFYHISNNLSPTDLELY